MLHFEVDQASLRSLVPAGTELDDWKGTHFISLLAFRFLRLRVFGVPIPLVGNFEEVNLRFYVRRVMPGQEPRHGVAFIREVVPHRTISFAARTLYGEPYVALETRSRVAPGPPPEVEYGWRVNGRWNECGAKAIDEAWIPPEGTWEAFLAHRNWGYTRQPDGRTLEYYVEHPRWRLWRVSQPRLQTSPVSWAGVDLPLTPTGPHSAFIADGSAVTVSAPARLSL
jgi:uncharacterized protein YqjF (DUF2071 family)